MIERIGSQHKSYDCICASGIGNATLHYVDNDKVLEQGVMTLNDMGAKVNGYCSDITCSWPVGGKFTEKQAQIYNAVLDANQAVFKALKPGVNWGDMHLLAERTMMGHLIKIGLVKEAPLDELEKKRVGAVFQPHGLGHFIGTRVHDVGGYGRGCPERSKLAGLSKLRTRRDIQKGNYITIEPGCYFNDYILSQAFNNPEVAPYLNKDKIDEYRIVGGVRIEDDV